MFKPSIDPNKFAQKYRPLVRKIAYQVYSKSEVAKHSGTMDMEECIAFGWEGFVDALHEFDSEKAGGDNEKIFAKYAAYRIQQAVKIALTKFSRTIAIPYYGQRKIVESGGETVLTTKLRTFSNNQEKDPGDFAPNYCEEPVLGFTDPFEMLIDFVRTHFDNRDQGIFFHTYGLAGYDIMRGIDLAKKYNIDNTTITNRRKRIIQMIQNDPVLLDELKSLLE